MYLPSASALLVVRAESTPSESAISALPALRIRALNDRDAFTFYIDGYFLFNDIFIINCCRRAVRGKRLRAAVLALRSGAAWWGSRGHGMGGGGR